MMKALLLPFFCLIISQALAQQPTKFDKSKEIGLSAGTSYYLGEINPYRHFGGCMHLALGVSFRNNFSRRWSLRLGVNYGNVEAWDHDSKDPWMRNRNLNIRNQFYEGNALVELNFLDYQLGSKDWISPYLFTGFAFYSSNPQGSINGQWRPLQPAGTEGQGTSGGPALYKTTGFALPAGVGLKMNIWAVFGFNLEWGIRRTWTDYFDDVSTTYPDPQLLANERTLLSAKLSDRTVDAELADGTNTDLQRGDPGRSDQYFFVMGTLTIRIDKRATTCWN